jgi:hypothetical protein
VSMPAVKAFSVAVKGGWVNGNKSQSENGV